MTSTTHRGRQHPCGADEGHELDRPVHHERVQVPCEVPLEGDLVAEQAHDAHLKNERCQGANLTGH